MGDNAKTMKEWSNLELGKGYQARGVVRQRGAEPTTQKVVDYSKAPQPTVTPSPLDQPSQGPGESINKNPENINSDSEESRDSAKKHSKKQHKSSKSSHKSSKPSKKSSSSHKSSSKKKVRFNPLLQLLATRLSNTTRSFSNN